MNEKQLIDLNKTIEEIQDFLLNDDKHVFDSMLDYMNYRANQITMIIENNCEDLYEWSEM